MFDFKFSKTMKDVQWSFISLLTASLSHLLLRILLGRELGPSGLGIYTLIFTIYMFGMQFAAFGIGAALTKYVAEFSDEIIKVKEYISAGFFGSIITGLVTGIVLFLLSGIISLNMFRLPEMIELLKITALCFPFIAIYKATTGTLNGFRNMKSFALLDISLNTSVLLISLIAVVLFNLGTFGAVLGFVIPTIFFGIVSTLFLRSNIIFPKMSLFKNDIFKTMSKFGFYVVLSGSVGMLYQQIDSLMLGYFLTETYVGQYAIAMIIIQGLALIPNSIQRITTPKIAYYYGKKEYENIIKLIKNVVFRTYVITFIMFMFLTIFGKYLIVTLFTNEFLPAYVPLLILLVGYTINAPIGSIGGILGSIGKIKISFKIAVICSMVNLIANALLIPKYGLIGAASATSFSYIVSTIVYYVILKRVIKNWN